MIVTERPRVQTQETNGYKREEEIRQVGKILAQNLRSLREDQRIPYYANIGGVLGTCDNTDCAIGGDIHQLEDLNGLLATNLSSKIELKTIIGPDEPIINPCCWSCGEDSRRVLTDKETRVYSENYPNKVTIDSLQTQIVGS